MGEDQQESHNFFRKFATLSPWEFGLVFVAFFILYECSLALRLSYPFPDAWYLDADSCRLMFTHPGSHPMANYQIAKHPLVAAIGVPLYRVGRFLSRSPAMPMRENFAVAFPAAVMGAINVWVALLVFRCLGFSRWRSYLPAVLYGTASSVWVFSSFPDSYIFTTLFTSLFLLCFVSDDGIARWKRLALVNALACYAAPQQILLAVIPVVRLLRLNGLKEGLRKASLYAAALLLIYVLPYAAFLAAGRRMTTPATEVAKWASTQNLEQPSIWAHVASTFAFVSQSAALIRPEALNPLSLQSIFSGGYLWLAALFVAGYAAWGLRRAFLAPELSLSFLLTVAFFVYWTPSQAFIFTAPSLLALWMIIHSGHVHRQKSAKWIAIVALMCSLNIGVNAHFMNQLTMPHASHVRVEPRSSP